MSNVATEAHRQPHHAGIGFGLHSFAHYRIRVLLYAGRPNWDHVATITPR